MKEIEDTIREFIAANILFSENGYPYADTDSFLTLGIIDSMGVLELVMFAEETFSIQINDTEIVPDNFDSVANFAAYVRTKKDVTLT